MIKSYYYKDFSQRQPLRKTKSRLVIIECASYIFWQLCLRLIQIYLSEILKLGRNGYPGRQGDSSYGIPGSNGAKGEAGEAGTPGQAGKEVKLELGRTRINNIILTIPVLTKYF